MMVSTLPGRIDDSPYDIGTRITAYHEAGHAVAAWQWFRHPLQTITIIPEDASLRGLTVFHEYPDWYSLKALEQNGPSRRLLRRLEREIMIGWAGIETESRFISPISSMREWTKARPGGPTDPDVFADRDQLDVWCLREEFYFEHEMARYLLGNGERVAAFFEHMRQRTYDHMERPEYRPAVERVAHALLKGQTLTWLPARALIEGEI
jgi:hypothetical protein